ncbi:MAG: bifunctional folylpolyglutamate synthase/dihydrofolate synthase, partial [Wenzhouxiangella sp.]
DVAHNAAAARQLAATLGPSTGSSIAVFAALADKNVTAMARTLDACFDQWLVAELDGPRGVPAHRLAEQLRAVPVTGGVEALESAAIAVRDAWHRCDPHGRIVVFGSFRTVAEAWPELEMLG